MKNRKGKDEKRKEIKRDEKSRKKRWCERKYKWKRRMKR